MFNPIFIESVCLSFSQKTVFEDFSTVVYPYARIGIVGRNGSGKSSLLKLLKGELPPDSGKISMEKGISIGFVEQTIDEFKSLSGGQRFNKRLSEVLAGEPDVLLLDEPTNHLDADNRKSLMRMLSNFPGIVIAVSHDREFLKTCVDTLLVIEGGTIHEFSGDFDDYIAEKSRKKQKLLKDLEFLQKQKMQMHAHLEKEQRRAAKSRKKGEKSISQKKWPTVVSNAKARRAQETSGKKKKEIGERKDQISSQIASLDLPEEIIPTFTLNGDFIGGGTILDIFEGSVSYDTPLLEHISLSLFPQERIAIEGKNGSGKSSLLKAILGDEAVTRGGGWNVIRKEKIGYLDQHYGNICPEKSVLDNVKEAMVGVDERYIRKHLSHFLFRTNEEVNALASTLSGGEKVRLSLCMIAADPKELLILDEITNNLDIETKDHVVQILKEYPGAMMIISHERDFLQKIGISSVYKIEKGSLLCQDGF